MLHIVTVTLRNRIKSHDVFSHVLRLIETSAMANRDFDPFSSASRGTEDLTPEFLPPLAKAKLDEFFLQVTFFVLLSEILGSLHLNTARDIVPTYLYFLHVIKYSF